MEHMHGRALLFDDLMGLAIGPTFLTAYVTVEDFVEKHKFLAAQAAEQAEEGSEAEGKEADDSESKEAE